MAIEFCTRTPYIMAKKIMAKKPVGQGRGYYNKDDQDE